MVQILPYVPSFGEKLAPVLSQSIGNIAEGYRQGRVNKQDQSILNGLFQNENATPMDQIKAFSSLSSDKQKTLTPIFSQLLKSQQKQQEAATKKAEESQLHTQKIEQKGEVLNELEGLKKYVGGYALPERGNPRTQAQKKQQIDSMAIDLEGYFRDQYTKGSLSAKVFHELLNRIPNSKMNKAEYQGSIDGIRKILETQGLGKESKATSSKAEKGQKITDDVVDKLLLESNGDAAKARAKAKELGYTF